MQALTHKPTGILDFSLFGIPMVSASHCRLLLHLPHGIDGCRLEQTYVDSLVTQLKSCALAGNSWELSIHSQETITHTTPLWVMYTVY